MMSQTGAHQFWALPFSLSYTPQLFAMALREVAQCLHHCGIKFNFHLDDWLIRHQEHLQFVLILNTHLAVCLAL